MQGKPRQVCHGDGLLQRVIAGKELHRRIQSKVLVSYILGEGVAWFSRAWCVRCGCDVIGTLSRT